MDYLLFGRCTCLTFSIKKEREKFQYSKHYTAYGYSPAKRTGSHQCYVSGVWVAAAGIGNAGGAEAGLNRRKEGEKFQRELTLQRRGRARFTLRIFCPLGDATCRAGDRLLRVSCSGFHPSFHSSRCDGRRKGNHSGNNASFSF